MEIGVIDGEYGISPAMAAVKALAAKTEAFSREDIEQTMRLIEIEESDTV